MAVQDVALLAGTGLAAVAASASWASVWQARQALNAGVLPELHVQGLSMGHENPLRETSRTMSYVVTNAGGGFAKGVLITFCHGDEYVTGFIGSGFMKPGDTVTVHTPIVTAEVSGTVLGIVACRDVRERSYVWDLVSPKPHQTKRKKDKPFHTVDELLAIAHPNVNLKTMRQVHFNVELRSWI